MDHLPEVSPFAFTTSSVVVGYLLIGRLTANEQGALGNWLCGVGQVLLTHGSYQLVLDERRLAYEENLDDNTPDSIDKFGRPYKKKDVDVIKMFQSVIEALEMEIAELKKSIDKK